jgi:sulfoxide reductase heme-binding subunit YedZ
MESIAVPWDWYTVRAAGLVGFLLLYVSIFVGTASCLPGIGKYFLRLRSLNFHCWISLQAFVFVLIHGIFLLFDRAVPFSAADILIPFHSGYEPGLVALGIIAFYLMIALVVSSYLRKYISHSLWRGIHFLNLSLYFLAVIHALYLGTDLQSGFPKWIFIWANAILMVLLLFNLVHRIWKTLKKEPLKCETQSAYENIRQGVTPVGPERSPENFRRRI